MRKMNGMTKSVFAAAWVAMVGLCGSAWAAEPVEYLAWDGKQLVPQMCTDYTVVTPDMATFEDGQWYVVEGSVTNTTGGIVVNGSAHLILMDDVAELVVKSTNKYSPGISVGATKNDVDAWKNVALTIYGQTKGTGRLSATGSGECAGIGGGQSCNGGIITINGGMVTAEGGTYGAGIGGGTCGSSAVKNHGGRVVINGGTVSANNSSGWGAGIGGGATSDGGEVIINGGKVTASCGSGWGASAIGCGASGDQSTGTLMINGGELTVKSSGAIGVSGTVKFGDAYKGGVKIDGNRIMVREEYEKVHSAKNAQMPVVGLEIPAVDGIVCAVSNETGKVTPLSSADGILSCIVTNHSALAVYFSLAPSYNYVEPPAQNPMVFADITDAITIPGKDMPRTYQTPVDYLEWDRAQTKLVKRTCEHYTVVTPETREFKSGWYVVMGEVTKETGSISVNCTDGVPANLILCDGAKLTLSRNDWMAANIMVYSDNVLSIYGQDESSGELIATSTYRDDHAGIGGGNNRKCGTINVNGGIITSMGSVDKDSGEAIGVGDPVKYGADGSVNLSEGFLWQVAVGMNGHGEQTVSAEEYMLDHHWRYAKLVAKPTTFVTAQPFNVTSQRDNGYFIVFPPSDAELAEDECWVAMGLPYAANQDVYDESKGLTYEQAFLGEMYGFVAGEEPVVAGSRSIAELEGIARRYWGCDTFVGNGSHEFGFGDANFIALLKCRRANNGELMVLTAGLVGDLQAMANGSTLPNELSTAVRTSYWSWSKKTKSVEGPHFVRAMPFTENTRTLRAGQWYVSLNDGSGGMKLSTVTVAYEAHLVLEDGSRLDLVPGGTDLPGLRLPVTAEADGRNTFKPYSSISIYGQKEGTGLLYAEGDAGAAGIGTCPEEYGHGMISVHGGHVVARGGNNGGAAIGAGADALGHFGGSPGTPCTLAINVYGGKVEAQAHAQAGGAGLGFGARAFMPHCEITVLGGDVTAFGSTDRYGAQALGWGADCVRSYSDPGDCDYLRLKLGRGMGLWTGVNEETGEDADDSRLSAAAYDEHVLHDDWRPYAHVKPAPALSVEVVAKDWQLVSYAIATNGAPMELENNRGDRTFQLPDVTEVEIVFTAEDGYVLDGEQTWTRFIGALDFEGASAFRVEPPEAQENKMISRQHFELVRNGDGSFTLALGDEQHVGLFHEQRWFVVTDGAEAGELFNDLWTEAQQAIGKKTVGEFDIRYWFEKIKAAGGTASAQFANAPQIALDSSVGRMMVFKVQREDSGVVMTAGGAFDLQTMTAGGDEVRTGSLDAECVKPLNCKVTGKRAREQDEYGYDLFNYALEIEEDAPAAGESYFWVAYRRLGNSGMTDEERESAEKRRYEFDRMASALVGDVVGDFEQRVRTSVAETFANAENDYFAETGAAASLADLPATLPRDTETVYAFRVLENGGAIAQIVAIGHCGGINDSESRWRNDFVGETVALPYFAWDEAQGRVVEQSPVEATPLSASSDGREVVLHANGWYVVFGHVDVEYGLRVDVGTAHLILADGASLSVRNGLAIADGAGLAVYSEKEYLESASGQGRFEVANYESDLNGAEPTVSGGTLEIHGGEIDFTGGQNAAIFNESTTIYGGHLYVSSSFSGGSVVSSRAIDVRGGRFRAFASRDYDRDSSYPKDVFAGEQYGDRCSLHVGAGTFVELSNAGTGEMPGRGYTTIGDGLDVRLDDGVYAWAGEWSSELLPTSISIYRARPKRRLYFNPSPERMVLQDFEITAVYDESVKTNGFTLTLPAGELRDGEKWCVVGFDESVSRIVAEDMEEFGTFTFADMVMVEFSLLASVEAELVGENAFAREIIDEGFEGYTCCYSTVTGESTIQIPADKAVDMVLVARVLDTPDLPLTSLGAAKELQAMANEETKGCGLEFLQKQEFSLDRNADGSFTMTMPEGDVLKPGECWAWVALPVGVGDDDEFIGRLARQLGSGMPAGFVCFDMFMDRDDDEILAYGSTTDQTFALPADTAGVMIGRTRPGLSFEEGPCEYLALSFGMASHLNVADYKDWPRHDELFPNASDYCKVTLVANDLAALIIAVDGAELGYRPDGVYTVRKGSEVRVTVLPVDPENYELRSPSVLVYADIQEDVTVGPQQVVVVPKAAPTPVADQGFTVRRGDDGSLTVDMSGEEPLGLGETWVCMTIDKGGNDLPNMDGEIGSFGDIIWRDAMGVLDDVNAGELPLDLFMVVPGAEGVVVSTNKTFAIPSDAEMALVARAYDGYNGKIGGNRYYGLSMGGVRFLTALQPGETAKGERWNTEHQVRYSAWDGEKIVHGLTTNALPLTAASFDANGVLAVTSNSFYAVTGKLEGNATPLTIDVKPGVTLSLLVKDGARMKIRAIRLPSTATLNVYGQDGGSGSMIFIDNSLTAAAAIGGAAGEGCGTVNFHGPTASFGYRLIVQSVAPANATPANLQSIHVAGAAKIGSTLDSTAANGTLNVYRGILDFNGGCAIGGGTPMQINVHGGEISVRDGWIGGRSDRKSGLVPGEGYQLQCQKAEDAVWTDMTVAGYEEELQGEVPPAGVRIFLSATVTFDAEIAKLVADGKLAVMASYQGKTGQENLPMTWTEAGGSCTVTCGNTVNVICLARGTESIRRPDVMTFACVTGDVAVAYADLNWHEPELVAAQKFEAYRCLDGRIRLTPKGKLAEGEAWLWIALPDYVAKEYAGDLTIAEKFAQTIKGAVDSKICYVGGVRAAGGVPVAEPMLRPFYNCIQGNMFLPTDGLHWGVSKEKSVFYAPADTDFALVCKVYDAGIAQMFFASDKQSAPIEAAEAAAEAAEAEAKPALKAVAASGATVAASGSAGGINVNKELFLKVGCRYTAETAGSAKNLQSLPRLPEYEPGDVHNPWPLGPEDAEEPVAYTNDTNTLVIKGKGPFAEPTKKPWTGEGAGPITEIVITDPETELPDDVFEGLGTPEPISVDLPDGWPADDLPVPGEPWHGGYVKIEAGHWPLTVGNVKFQQRYPWNGLVDVTFDLTGSTNVELGVWAKTGATTVAASNFVGRADMTFAVEGKKTVKLVWDAEKDLLPGDLTKLVLENATITVGTGKGGAETVICTYDINDTMALKRVELPMGRLADLSAGDEIVFSVFDNGTYEPEQGFRVMDEFMQETVRGAAGRILLTQTEFNDGFQDVVLPVTEEVVQAVRNGDQFFVSMTYKSLRIASISVRRGGVGIGAESAAGVIDLAKGTRVAREIENIVIDPAWGAAAKASVLWPRAETAQEYDAATVEEWNTARLPAGKYEFAYTAGATSYTAAFWVPANNWTVIDHETIAGERPVTGEKVLVAGENVIVPGGKLVIDGCPEIIWDGTFRVEKGGKIYAPYFDVVVDPATGLVTLEPKARPTVTGLRFAQRYPWNGLVDVFFTATYAADPAAKVFVKLAAKLDGEEKQVKTLYLANDPATTNTQFQVSQGEVHLIWDTMKDVGLENFGALEITAQAALVRMAEEGRDETEEESKLLCLTPVKYGGKPATTVRITIQRVINEEPLQAAANDASAPLLGKEFERRKLDIQYSYDQKKWNQYDGELITIEVGQKLYLKGYNPDGLSTYEEYVNIQPQSGFFAASGSVMSLIDGKGEATEIPCEYCFYRLFYQCPALTQAPDLTATTLKDYCYRQMFTGVSSADRIKMLGAGDLIQVTRVINTMIKDLSGGTLVLNPCWKQTTLHISSDWKIVYDGEENLPEPLCFTPAKGSGDLQIAYDGKRELNIEISYDGQKWEPYDPRKNGSFYLKDGDMLYVRGKNPDGLSSSKDGSLTFQTTVPFNVSGDVMSLIDYEKKVAEIPCDYCFSRLFADAQIITADLALSATVLKPYCYENMFANCSRLEGRMVLPAKNLVEGCYEGMFNNCINLSYIKMLAETYDGVSDKLGEFLLKTFSVMLNSGLGKAYGGTFVYSSNADISKVLPQLNELGKQYNWTVISESDEKLK